MEIEIYTGYYANIRKYLAGGCVLIGISVGTPSYLKGNNLLKFRRSFAPTYAMIRIEDEAEYTRQYKANILGRLDYRQEVDAIKALASAEGKTKAVLLCYEKPPKFCHRSLVAEWLNSHGEMFVHEYGYEGESEKPAPAKTEQGDLFAEAGIEIRSMEQKKEWKDWR